MVEKSAGPYTILAKMAGDLTMENHVLRVQLEQWLRWGEGDGSLQFKWLLNETRAVLGK